ncbi:MAG: hypothetical protein RMJ54_18060, partial [Roseiflexaceae bacterium]|nr:hypothetical protein [Roseiflexaceae bacterium]
HPDHEDLLEWAGGAFDPEHFDIAGVNARLHQLRWGGVMSGKQMRRGQPQPPTLTEAQIRQHASIESFARGMTCC